MGQNDNFQKRDALFSRRVRFDLPKKMSEIHKLREAVRLAEMAASKKPIDDRPEGAITRDG